MIRKRKLLVVDDMTQQVCCTLSQTRCNCECPDCNGCNDCVDCPNLTIANVNLLVYRAGDYIKTSGTCIPNYLLSYGAFTLVGQVVCFMLDMQIMAFAGGRYVGEVQVNGVKAGEIDFMLGAPFSICQPYTTGDPPGGNDMQP